LVGTHEFGGLGIITVLPIVSVYTIHQPGYLAVVSLHHCSKFLGYQQSEESTCGISAVFMISQFLVVNATGLLVPNPKIVTAVGLDVGFYGALHRVTG
jgi:hypothetical protein